MSESDNKDRRRIEAYRKELEADPKSLAFVALAEALNRTGGYEEAREVAQSGLRHHRDSVAGRLALAIAHAGRKNVREALEQIKSALIIDQQNPRALALMGTLLLDKGLAKRAAQFLSQAVKLAPESREYADQLRRARRLAKKAPSVPLPVVRGEDLEDSNNPWTEDGSKAADIQAVSDSEHTVFDPKALKMRGKPRAKPSNTTERVPTNNPAEGEHTAFATSADIERLSRPKTPGASNDAGDDARVSARRPKMGGSAADYSQLIAGDGGGTQAEHTVAAKKDAFLESPTVDGVRSDQLTSDEALSPDGRTTRMGAEELKQARGVRPPVEAPSVRRARSTSEPPAVPEIVERSEPSVPVAAPKAEAEAVVEKPASKVADLPASTGPKSAVVKPVVAPSEEDLQPIDPMQSGRPSTMFVDDAVWAIYGGDRPAAKSPDDKAADEDKAPKKPASPKPAPASAPPAARRRSVLVVRTSDWFGQLTGWLAVGIVAAVCVWIGYSVAVGQSGAAPAEATEEIKGVASDLERGGLAALRAAEETIVDLVPRAPEAEPLLRGALAEVYASMWSDFGGDPAHADKARVALAATAQRAPSVEVLKAQISLSTASAGLDAIDVALSTTIERFPRSPKAWTARASVAEKRGRADDAMRALYHAYAIHPTRRATLLALARHHARHGAYASAFAAFDDILEQDSFRDDVEVLIDRFVLGEVTNADPAKNEAQSRLAGLVRDDLPGVANDEVGRVALAFSLGMLARGDRVAALEQLASAEASYERSACFKGTVGGILIALGEWDRAKEQLTRALAVDPTNDAWRLGLARASFGLQAELQPPPSRDPLASDGGVYRLPFATARFVPGKFELIDLEFDAAVFPEVGYKGARARGEGSELVALLEAQNLIALADSQAAGDDHRAAIRTLEKAKRLDDSAAVAVRLGRAYAARNEHGPASRAFERALSFDKADIAARYGLGVALAAQSDILEAIEALEPLAEEDVLAPEALRLLATLKRQRGDDEGAQALLRRVVEVDPRDVGLLLELGRTSHLKKAPDEALGFYRRALELSAKLSVPPKRKKTKKDARTPVDLYYLGRILLERTEKKGAPLLFASTRYEDAPAEAHFYLGKTLIKKRRTKKAGRRALQLYLKAAPTGEFVVQAQRLLKGP